jgi:hypothetical protein
MAAAVLTMMGRRVAVLVAAIRIRRVTRLEAVQGLLDVVEIFYPGKASLAEPPKA